MKKKRFELLLSEEQSNEVKHKTESNGFSNSSDYIRHSLFMETDLKQEIMELRKQVAKLVQTKENNSQNN